MTKRSPWHLQLEPHPNPWLTELVGAWELIDNQRK